MNNAQFSKVLKLWLQRVVEKQDDTRRAVLKAQYRQIVALNAYRQAVVHSRWEWRPDAPDLITAVRVHNKIVNRVTFTSEALLELSIKLGQIRYQIRYPGGIEEHAAELAATGGYISRRGWERLTGRVNWNGSAPVKDSDDAS